MPKLIRLAVGTGPDFPKTAPFVRAPRERAVALAPRIVPGQRKTLRRGRTAERIVECLEAALGHA